MTEKNILTSYDDDVVPPNHICWYCRKPISGMPEGLSIRMPAGQYHSECYEEQGRAYMDLAKDGEERRKENQKKLLEERGGPPLCHCCGESCLLGEYNEECGLVGAEVSGGYWSTPGNGEGSLDDSTLYKFNICEFCLDWLFQHFTQPIERIDYMSVEKMDGYWIPAEQRIIEDEWRKNPDPYRKEATKRARLRCPILVDFNSKDEHGRIRLNAQMVERDIKIGNHILVTDEDVSSLGIVEQDDGTLVVKLVRKPFLQP